MDIPFLQKSVRKIRLKIKLFIGKSYITNILLCGKLSDEKNSLKNSGEIMTNSNKSVLVGILSEMFLFCCSDLTIYLTTSCIEIINFFT